MKILLSGTIETLSTRNDGTLKVVFGTQECDTSQAGQLFQMRGKYVKCLLSDSNITDLESALVDEQKMTGTKVKSPSKRLRSVMYLAWEKSGLDLDFETYYSNELEKIITHFKSKLY